MPDRSLLDESRDLMRKCWKRVRMKLCPMDQTRKFLKQNRQHLDAVSKALLGENRLYRKDLEEIVAAIPQKATQT